MHRESAPAGADLDHAVVGPEAQLVADAVELAGRGDVQRVVLAGVQRRGVHQVIGQEQAEERITEVVVRGDVAARAIAGIAPQCIPAAHRQPAQPCRPALHAVEQVAVAHQQLHQADQVAAIPLAIHVRLGRAYAAVGGERAIEAGRVHVDTQRHNAGDVFPRTLAAERIDQHDLASAQGL